MRKIPVPLEVTNSFGHAKWIATNGQKYVYIKADNHYNLGRLEGIMLEHQIRYFKRVIQLMGGIFFLRNGFGYSKFLEIARGYEEEIPVKIKVHYNEYSQEMHGIADSIPDITYDDLLLQNCFIDLVYGSLIPLKRWVFPESLDADLGCTAIAGKDKDGNVFLGQNFDFNIFLKNSLSYVHSILPGLPEVFSFRMGGMLALPSALNSDGLRLLVNIVKSRLYNFSNVPTGIRTRLALEYSASADECYEFITGTEDAICYNLTIADDSHIFGCQINPIQKICVEVDDWHVFSNTFIDPRLQQYLFKKKYSKYRQAYTESRMKAIYPDKIDEGEILSILSDNPVVCRKKTIAFITNHYFGLGNPRDDGHGVIPIKFPERKEV